MPMRLVLLLGVLVLGACTPKVIEQSTPVGRLDEARRLTRRGQWSKALPIFQRLAFDLSAGHAALPEIGYLTGEALFQTGSFAEASDQFRSVSDQYPESPYAPLALLRAGDANLRMWRKPQLDPTQGEAALAIYQELAGRYPQSDAAARANLHVRRLRDWFAEKTYHNGMFYLRRKAYDSAILYFKEVVAGFSETSWAGQALLKLITAYDAIGYVEERNETCEHIRRYYPRAAASAEGCPAAPVPSASP